MSMVYSVLLLMWVLVNLPTASWITLVEVVLVIFISGAAYGLGRERGSEDES